VGANLHKWIGAPLGLGFLYVREGRLQDIDIDCGNTEHPPTDIRARVNAGTLNVAAVMTIPSALAFHARIPLAARAAHLRALRDYWVTRVRALPGVQERFAMASLVSERLIRAGYLAVGIDHFAKPGDSLATALQAGAVHRNFQGYTTDAAPGLVGLGASSIGRVGRGYVQNVVATGEYMRAVKEGRLPVLRGKELTDIDRVVGAAIEDLMCAYAFSVSDLERRFGPAASVLRPEAAQIRQQDGDDMTEFDGDVFSVTPKGQAFVRTIASRFDRYFGQGAARHSVAV